MWYMIAVILTGYGTQFYMERGLSSEESCNRMAARYKAFERFNTPGRMVKVDVACLAVDTPPAPTR